jgi:uncharacterized membrane protein YfcA
MIAAVLLGLVIGLALGALGGGGSVLAVPVLVHLAGQPVVAATATSLVAVGVSAAVGAVGHARAGRVRWGAAAAFVATGVPGSWAGSALNERIDGDVLLLAFSGIVLVAAHRMLTACPSCTREGDERAVEDAALADGPAAAPSAVAQGGHVAGGVPHSGGAPVPEAAVVTPALAPGERDGATPATLASRIDARSLARLVVAGTAVGFLTGLFGVGGGFVIVPALTLGLGLSLPTAIGTSLAVIVGNSAVALTFRGTGAVDWSVALPFTITMLAGTAAGALLASRLPARRALHAFAVLLVAVALANGAAALVAVVG